jgi:hypothetical protein
MNQNWQFSERQLFVIYLGALVCGMSLMGGILGALYGKPLDLVVVSGLLSFSMLIVSIKTVIEGKPKL